MVKKVNEKIYKNLHTKNGKMKCEKCINFNREYIYEMGCICNRGSEYYEECKGDKFKENRKLTQEEFNSAIKWFKEHADICELCKKQIKNSKKIYAFVINFHQYIICDKCFKKLQKK